MLIMLNLYLLLSDACYYYKNENNYYHYKYKAKIL